MASDAEQSWKTALKLRNVVLREVNQLKSDSSAGVDVAHFDKIDTLMSNYRLACVQTLFMDIKYASEERVDEVLWQSHSFVKDRYREVVSRLKSPQHVVLKRKIEKQYGNFLKISQYFYKGYVQRLCARYKIPRLEHIARSMELEPMPLKPEEHVDAVAQGLGGLVIRSCHLTLIYLGDLSRYRSQMRQKAQGSETALTYYALANDLVPASGYGHHQMGVIFLDEKKHFEIVYHFYRAWAAEVPHPNAANNLEVEFRDLLRRAAPMSHGAFDALKFWFLRLHAHFNQGHLFPQHAEMEKEVLHRFEMALKSQDAGPTLLRLVLINVCAYLYAQEKVRAKWSEAASQRCQFILQLNVRMILALARLVRSELQDLDKHTLVGSSDRQGEQGSNPIGEGIHTTPVIGTALPILRVLMGWLVIDRADVVQYAPFLQPYIEEMYGSLSQALTSLFEVYGGRELVSAPYLLAEDLELQGIKAFVAPDLPDVVQTFCSLDGQRKARVNDSSHAAAVNLEAELLNRVWDVLKCGFFLAGDAAFPFVIQTVQRDGREFTVVRYVDDSDTAQQDVPRLNVDVPQTGLAVDETGLNESTARLTLDFTSAEARTGSVRLPADSTGYYGPGSRDGASASASAFASGRLGETEMRESGLMADEPEPDFDETQLLGMVNEFLAPPEASSAQRQHPPRGETSYGLQTSSADESFGAAARATSPAPGSGTAKAFPSLPWNYFYTPTPQARSGQQRDQMGSSHSQNDPGSLALPASASAGSASIGIQGVDHLDDPFGMDHDVRRYNNLVASAPEGAEAAWAEAEQYRLLGKGLVYRDEATRGIYGDYPGQEWGTQGQLWDAGVVEPVQRTNQMQAPFRHSDSPFDRAGVFSGNTSSLPPVNSPWGLRNAGQPTMGMQQQQQQPQQVQQPPNALALPSTASSGPLQGGPYNQGLTYNGVTYNATTAYGRGAIATKDDPTHFKNVVKSSGLADIVAQADEYDQKVLASAFADDFTPRR